MTSAQVESVLLVDVGHLTALYPSVKRLFHVSLLSGRFSMRDPQDQEDEVI